MMMMMMMIIIIIIIIIEKEEVVLLRDIGFFFKVATESVFRWLSPMP